MEIVVSRGALTPHSAIDALHGVERLMAAQEQVEPAVRHYFGTGTYCREMIIEPDILVSGRMHRGSTITVILSGEVQVFSNHGAIGYFQGGEVMVTPPMTKRLWYSVGGCRLLTVHSALNTIDLKELEDEILVPLEEEMKLGEQA